MWIFQKKLKQGCNQDWISLGKSLRNTRKMRSVHEVTLICFWLYPHTILRLRLNNFYFQIESKEILSFLSEGKNHQKWCNGGCKKPKCVWDKKGCSGLAPEGSKKPKAEAGNDYMMWWFSNLLYNYLLLQGPSKLSMFLNLVWGPVKYTKSNFNPVHVFLHFGTFCLEVLQLILSSKLSD